MSLIYNDTIIKNVIYNNSEIETLNYNGITVFEKTPTYEILDYLQSTGTQFIDTKYTNQANTILEIECSFDSYVDGCGHGAMSWNNYGRFHMGTENTSTIHVGQGNNTNNVSIDNITNKHLYKMQLSNATFYVDNTLRATSNSITQVFHTLYLFRINSSDSSRYQGWTKGKIYSCKIYNGSTLVRDYIPCRRYKDKVLGLYDVTNKVFYTNNGTGVFTGGGVIGKIY